MFFINMRKYGLDIFRVILHRFALVNIESISFSRRRNIYFLKDVIDMCCKILYRYAMAV